MNKTLFILLIILVSAIIIFGIGGFLDWYPAHKLMKTPAKEDYKPIKKEDFELPIIIDKTEISENEELAKIFNRDNTVLRKIQLSECKWVYQVIFTDEERTMFYQILNREKYETIDLDTFISIYREIVETLKRGGIY